MNPAPCRVWLRFAASYCSFRHFTQFTSPRKMRDSLAFVISFRPLRRERSGVRIPSRLPPSWYGPAKNAWRTAGRAACSSTWRILQVQRLIEPRKVLLRSRSRRGSRRAFRRTLREAAARPRSTAWESRSLRSLATSGTSPPPLPASATGLRTSSSTTLSGRSSKRLIRRRDDYTHPLRPHAPNANSAARTHRFLCKTGLPTGTPDA